MKFLAIIVTYNPDVERLNENLKAISCQTDKVVIVDNGSDDNAFLERLSFVYNTAVISNEKNKGIAYALNQGMRYAYENGYEWAITLDEDSVCPDNIISSAKKIIEEKSRKHNSLSDTSDLDCKLDDIAIIVPLIKETASGELCELGTAINDESCQEVKKCITSAAITNVGIWKKLRGFDNKMFIDYVDYDYAIRCIINNYKIVRMNNVILDHRIGKSEYRKFLWTRIRVANHSPYRKYYIARNIVIYIKRYSKHISVVAELLRLFKVLLLIVLYEDNKAEKLRAYFKGLSAGIKFRV
ncbi:MAG: glycosyltransferase family 2 protein [Lachnospiraceae bacterium]|nr:glycosyltransferase family 2 protein [Lachnospiraceae bacterium]